MLLAVRVGTPAGTRSWAAWSFFVALMFATSMALWFHPVGPRHARAWLRLAAASVLLATMFWAANQALDLIKPPGSRRQDIASTVGGFELWTLLCPGLTAVALAGWLRSLMLREHASAPRA